MAEVSERHTKANWNASVKKVEEKKGPEIEPKKAKQEKKGTAAPRIPTWSPTAVLTRRHLA